METTQALVKMAIDSFPNRDFSGAKKSFKVPVNPENFSKNYKVEYETRRPHGQHGTNGRFNSTAPEEFKIEFTLDGTNTIEGYEYDGLFKKETASDANVNNRETPNEDLVDQQLQKFLETVYELDGEIHRPRFCKVTWGVELFQGILSNLDVNYNLFHPNGKALRIKISATFLDYVAKEERERRKRNRSPDLTRLKRLKDGERLEKMVQEIYGDNKFLLQVARANSLTSFRKIPIGLELRFPPVDKTDNT